MPWASGSVATSDGRDHAVAGAEAEVGVERVQQALDEQARRDEQHDRRRHLAGDEHAPQPRAAAAVRRAFGRRPQRHVGRRARRVQRRRQAEEQTARQRQRGDEGDRAHVDRRVQQRRLLGGEERRQDVGGPQRQRAGRRSRRRGRAAGSRSAAGGPGALRPAPSASRTAISRSRAIARDTSRPATLAQAMTSTRPTAPIRIAPIACSIGLKSGGSRECGSDVHRPRRRRRLQRARDSCRGTPREARRDRSDLRLRRRRATRRAAAGRAIDKPRLPRSSGAICRRQRAASRPARACRGRGR